MWKLLHLREAAQKEEEEWKRELMEKFISKKLEQG